MILSSHTLIDDGIIITNGRGKPAQVGYDLTINNIRQVPGLGKIADGKTSVKDYWDLTPTNNEDGANLNYSHCYFDPLTKQTMYYLVRGVYSVTFDQGCALPNQVCGWIKPRSSLARIGATIVTGVYDPGFKTEFMGAFIHVVLIKFTLLREKELHNLLPFNLSRRIFMTANGKINNITMNNALVNNARAHKDKTAWEYIGWMYALACSLIDQGIDLRHYEVPHIMKDAVNDLGLTINNCDPVVKTQIIVRLQVEGIHCWPDCNIPEVSYLRRPHRHIFWIEARKAVSHDNRDIEIIQLGHEMREYLRACYYDQDLFLHDFGAQSCEMLSRQLLEQFELDSCQVLEDNENGSIVTSV